MENFAQVFLYRHRYIIHTCICLKRTAIQWRIQDFPEGGAPTLGGGRQPIICLIFPENCMKMKKFWPRGGGARPWRPPLDPPLRQYFNKFDKFSKTKNGKNTLTKIRLFTVRELNVILLIMKLTYAKEFELTVQITINFDLSPLKTLIYSYL